MGRFPLEEIELGRVGRAGSVGPFRLVVMMPLGLRSGVAEIRAGEGFRGHDEVMDG